MKQIFLTALVVVSACSRQGKVPEDLISQDSMTILMIEVHVLESKVKNLNIRPQDSANVVYQHYENLLFADFNITKEQYERSFNYYIDNVEELKTIYDAVVDTLMQREKLEID